LKYYWESGKKLSLDDNYVVKRINNYPKLEPGSLKNRLKSINWLKPSFLKLWIKLESIWPCKLFSPIDISMHRVKTSGSSWSDFYKKVEAHRRWIDDELIKITEEEREILKQFSISVTYSSRSLLDSFSDLNDLFYLISYDKKDILATLTLYLNLLEISRRLKSIYWSLTKKNVWGKLEKPPFVIEEENERLLFFNNVLLEYGLFPTEPFIVFVEGGTEYEILSNYKIRRAGYENLGFVNLQGIGNLRDTVQNISNYFKNRLSFILLDYDNKKKYEERIEILINHGIDPENDAYFFVPDFVTENFSIPNVLDCYLSWLRKKNLILEEEDKNIIKIQLNYALGIRRKIIENLTEDIQYKNEIRFENILINNTLKQFNEEILSLYPRYDFNKKEGIKKFSKQFKREFSPLLTEIVINWFRQDDRKEFSFEKALWPFYSKTEEYRLKLVEKKFKYSPYKFFY